MGGSRTLCVHTWSMCVCVWGGGGVSASLHTARPRGCCHFAFLHGEGTCALCTLAWQGGAITLHPCCKALPVLSICTWGGGGTAWQDCWGRWLPARVPLQLRAPPARRHACAELGLVLRDSATCRAFIAAECSRSHCRRAEIPMGAEPRPLSVQFRIACLWLPGAWQPKQGSAAPGWMGQQ